VVVGPSATGQSVVRLREVNWLVPPARLACTVKLRSRDALHPAEVVPSGTGALVTLAEPAPAAPGQACVFYAGERVLGGGFICSTARNG
jgi:tRNA-specific 2-thiouridylase